MMDARQSRRSQGPTARGVPNAEMENHAPTTVPAPAPSPGPPSAADADEWTVLRLLTWTADYLKRHGSESPRLDAEVMLSSVLKWERVDLYTHFGDAVAEAPRAAFRELVRRRAQNEPVAYLVGRKEFYSLMFEVGPAVLIPRPDSEWVIVEFLSAVKGRDEVRAVDVGTGSGCLAIAAASKHAGARLEAIDISERALEIARKNAQTHKVADRIEFRQGDLLAPAASAGAGPFDVVLSNPPYVPTAEIERLAPGVRDYEPRAALDGGPSGLEVVGRLIEEAVPLLKPGGHLILEIGADQEAAVRGLLEAQPALRAAPTVFDHNQRPRVLRATRTA